MLSKKLQVRGRARNDAPVEEEEANEAADLRECPPVWADNISHVLFTKSAIQSRVKELAHQISTDYVDKEIVVVGLLTGAICFVTDLVRSLRVPYTMDFMALSSYHGTQSKGIIELKKDMSHSPENKHILVVEDIVDTGTTLQWLSNYLMTKNCASVRIACLLDKKEGRSEANTKIKVDYCGFVCPNSFVVGYGLDFEQEYRGLPFIGVLKPSAYNTGGDAKKKQKMSTTSAVRP